MVSPPYALIAGQGRSGTNWLLSILDASNRTHCRNEPDAIEGASLSRLPTSWIPPVDEEAFALEWDRGIQRVCRTVGQTDHPPKGRKIFIRSWARRLGVYDRLLLSPTMRRWLRPLEPRLSQHPWEFELPRWLGDPAELSRALTVIKLCQVPGWIRWVLRYRSEIPVFHIVRHPGGFLNSWTNRWLGKNDRGDVTIANRRRLEIVRSAEPDWADRFGEIELMSAQESELWFWLYATETIHTTGQRRDQYRLVVFDDFAEGTQEFMVDIYERCGLCVTDEVREQVGDLSKKFGSIAGAWRSKLDRGDRDCVERILEQSRIKDFWD